MVWSFACFIGLASFSSLASAVVQRPPVPFRTVSFDGGFNLTSTDNEIHGQTSYILNKCTPEQREDLETAIYDAVWIAAQGYDLEPRQGGPVAKWLDFGWDAAVAFFGPKDDKGNDQKDRIFSKTGSCLLWSSHSLTPAATLDRAASAYRGTGAADWILNRYVMLSCEDVSRRKDCDLGRVVAYNDVDNKEFRYPLIIFCPIYFSHLRRFDDALDVMRQNHNRAQENTMNLRSQGIVVDAAFNCHCI